MPSTRRVEKVTVTFSNATGATTVVIRLDSTTVVASSALAPGDTVTLEYTFTTTGSYFLEARSRIRHDCAERHDELHLLGRSDDGHAFFDAGHPDRHDASADRHTPAPTATTPAPTPDATSEATPEVTPEPTVTTPAPTATAPVLPAPVPGVVPVAVQIGPAVPEGFVLRTVFCDTPLYVEPNGDRVPGGAAVRVGQTWFVAPEVEDETPDWIEGFFGGENNAWLPANCVG